MKSNRDLGFVPLFGEEGQNSSEVNADGGGSLSIDVTVGQRGKVYRAYAYQWHHEQDASREGIRDEVSCRADDPMEAARRWRVAALRRGWHAPGVEAAYSDLIDEIAEALDD